MLAKEIKIKTLKVQREFIKKQLSGMVNREDGDASYRYVGHVYPEVIAYFEEEGFVVTKVESDMLTANNKGLPTYLFVIGDVKLTEEELNEAETIEIKEDEEDDAEELPGYDEFMASILGGCRE